MSVEMKQLQKFLEWDLDRRPDCSDRKHVVQWAIDRIRELEAEVERFRSDIFPQYPICPEHPYLTGTSLRASALGCPYCKLARLVKGLRSLQQYSPSHRAMSVDSDGGWVSTEHLEALIQESEDG